MPRRMTAKFKRRDSGEAFEICFQKDGIKEESPIIAQAFQKQIGLPFPAANLPNQRMNGEIY